MAYKLGNVQESVIPGYGHSGEREGNLQLSGDAWFLTWRKQMLSAGVTLSDVNPGGGVAVSTLAVKGTWGTSDLLLQLD